MRRKLHWPVAAAIAFAAPAVAAPTADAVKPDRPTAIAVRRVAGKGLFVSASGRTLYALNMRLAMARTGQTRRFCVGTCAADWAPFAPATGDKAVGDWTIAQGADGPQWAYRNALVFTFRADAAGQKRGDGYQDIFGVIAYVPPAPTFLAPAAVAPLYRDGRYVLADRDKHPLYVPSGSCRGACDRTPLGAGMAARPIGDWTVLTSADRPQWAYRGKPVFVDLDGKDTLPSAAIVLAGR